MQHPRRPSIRLRYVKQVDLAPAWNVHGLQKGGGAYDKGKVFPKSRCVTLCRPISFRGQGQKAATPESSSLMEGWVGSKFASGKMSHKEKHYDRAEISNSMGVWAERPPVRTSTSLDQWAGYYEPAHVPMCPCGHVCDRDTRTIHI